MGFRRLGLDQASDSDLERLFKTVLRNAFMLAQAARLLVAFREFKRRESVGLVPYYANKLAALEEALLGCRYGGGIGGRGDGRAGGSKRQWD